MSEVLLGLWIGCFISLLFLGIFFIKPSLIDYFGMVLFLGTVIFAVLFVVFYPVYHFLY